MLRSPALRLRRTKEVSDAASGPVHLVPTATRLVQMALLSASEGYSASV